MKYKLLKDLPFMKVGEIFTTGCWVSGGWGVDLGDAHYEGGGSSHNGIKVFEKHENKILDKLVEEKNKDWIEIVPTDKYEVLRLFQEGYYDIGQAVKRLEFKLIQEGGVE
jgi:hypothetical protein